MENSVVTQNKSEKLVIIVLVLLLLVACGFICYDKFIDKKEATSKECNCPTSNDVVASCDTMQNQDGKIVVKRNGVAKLENVPSDIVGQYQNDDGDYYKLNADGTAEIYANTGCGNCDPATGLISAEELSYQLDYISRGDNETVIVEFFLNSKKHSEVPGVAIYGSKWQGSYSFYLISHTPTSIAGETVFSKK